MQGLQVPPAGVQGNSADPVKTRTERDLTSPMVAKSVAVRKILELIDGLNDDEYRDVLTEMGELNIEGAKIEAAYYKKMCKAVSAKKAYRIKMADDAFHREALRKFNHGQNDKNQSKRKP